MKREWQPGDVALIGFRDYMPVPALYVSARQRWVDVDGAEFDGDEDYLTLRPLVVVDPDDQAQADRLSDALITAMCKSDPDWDKAREYEVRSHMRTALREFADPKPPRCKSALIVKGEHFACDQSEGHGMSHANQAAGAIWGEGE